MKLSKNFDLEEFEKSQTATRLGISNKVPPELIPNIQKLVDNVLQPTRDNFGYVNISSGYRSLRLNTLIGGSKNSQHMKAEAADFTVKRLSNLVVARWIKDNCKFDQLILEFYDKDNPLSGWIHCSYSDNNRNEVLTAKKVNGKTHYFPGLPDE